MSFKNVNFFEFEEFEVVENSVMAINLSGKQSTR